MTNAITPVTITGIEPEATFRTRIERLMTSVIERAASQPVRGVVSFFDDNGPKGGPAMRCALTVSIPHRRSIRVERRAETFDFAFKAAFTALERKIEQDSERDRQGRRHPKKYYAARRAMNRGRASRKGRRT